MIHIQRISRPPAQAALSGKAADDDGIITMQELMDIMLVVVGALATLLMAKEAARYS